MLTNDNEEPGLERQSTEKDDRITSSLIRRWRAEELAMVYIAARSVRPDSRDAARDILLRDRRPRSVIADFDAARAAIDAGKSLDQFLSSQGLRPEKSPNHVGSVAPADDVPSNTLRPDSNDPAS